MHESIEPADFDIIDEVEGAGAHLRDYQTSATAEIINGWRHFDRILIVLATGLGKTVIFCEVCRIIAEDPDARILIIAHTDELVNQSIEKLERFTGLPAAKEKAGQYASAKDPIVCASVQTIRGDRRLAGFGPDHFTHIIIDEAHRSLATSYTKVVDYFGKAKLLGVTATPDRGDQKSLGRLYEQCVFEFSLLQGVNEGWLVRPFVKTIPLKIDLSDIKTRGGDYDAGEVGHRIDPFVDDLAAAIDEHNEGRKTMIFVPTVETATLMSAALQKRGIAADWVAGDQKRCPDRVERIERFRNNEFRVIVNAMLLTEGYDDTDVSCIVVLRPTKIRALYVQAVGRGTRVSPGTVEGLATAEERCQAIADSRKPNLLILDFLWLTERLDLIRPANLVTGNTEVAERVAKRAEGDLLKLTDEEEKDFLESLRSEAAKHARKKGRLFDPLAQATVFGVESAEKYQPASQWEALPPTVEQIKFLAEQGVDTTKIPFRGLASKWIRTITDRKTQGLCSLRQANFLRRIGYKDGDAEAALNTTAKAARAETVRFIKHKNRKR